MSVPEPFPVRRCAGLSCHYRVRLVADRWVVDALPWLGVDATSRSEAIHAARSVIAAWLGVAPHAFAVDGDELYVEGRPPRLTGLRGWACLVEP